MVKHRYVPERGDLVRLAFSSASGHEQAGHRPAVVLSPAAYNGKVGLALFCPITSREKGYPFEVRLPEGLPVQGVILSDQVKSLDWKARRAKPVGQLSKAVIGEVLGKLATLTQA
ncbi:MAG: endoribonuclease MazF [Gemmatimonadetes bacterium]|nr:endoribonuclease MazF [Gemmatimonadota bacterium]